MTEAETETVETVVEEHVENPAAVLRKNRELLADLKATKDRAAALEDLARDLGLDADALADPRAHIARRAEDRTASEHRERLVKEAVLTALVEERRTPKTSVEDIVKAAVADPDVKLDNGKVTGLDRALKAAPRKAAPMMPPSGPMNSWERVKPTAPETFEQLAGRGPEAVSLFAQQSPERYAELRADFERRLAKPERTR